MVVKRLDTGDDWPDELWTFDPKRWACRYEWLDAAMAFAKEHRYNRLPIVRLYVNRRPLGTELATELPDACRQKIRPRPVNGHNGATR
jgi:hypothetical protein